MNRGLIYSFMALALSACGKPQVLELGQFAPYVKAFEDSSAEHSTKPVKVTDLRVQFGVMQNPLENGACEIVGNGTPTININEATWKRLTEEDRKGLMFHELGHCVLHRNHVREVSPQGIPVSLMNPYRINTQTLVANEEWYMKELFTRSGDF